MLRQFAPASGGQRTRYLLFLQLNLKKNSKKKQRPITVVFTYIKY